MDPFIFVTYFIWHYTTAVKNLLQIWGNFLRFFWHFFSAPLLLSSYLAPWHGILTERKPGLAAEDIGKRVFDNTVSRVLGALMRSFILGAWLAVELFVIASGTLILVGWLFMPLIIFISFFYGLLRMFTG